jgi:epoxyqueuosine reductase
MSAFLTTIENFLELKPRREMKFNQGILFTLLQERGYRAKAISVHHLKDIQQDIEGRYARGDLGTDFYQERLTFLDYLPPIDLPVATSIIVVAVPRPQHRVIFNWAGKRLALIMPPTYVGYSEISRQIVKLVEGWLAPEGYHVASTRLPLKTLAVRSGLCQYGRNNICYIPGMGSFFQLSAVYTDLPCPEEEWNEPQMVEHCQSCHACERKCPTGAISSDRFLLHAERCIVYHNEKSGVHPFPTWIPEEAHNCLVGCMLCQKYCPEDKQFMDWIEDSEEFSERETSILLKNVTLDRIPLETKEKLERLELLDSFGNMPRNLGVFIGKD